MSSPQAPSGIPSPAIDIDDLPRGIGPNTLMSGAQASELWTVDSVNQSASAISTTTTVSHDFGSIPLLTLQGLTYINTALSAGIHSAAFSNITDTQIDIELTEYTSSMYWLVPQGS